MPQFGSHLSVAGGFEKAARSAAALGCTSLQIFTKAPSQWAGRAIDDDEARVFLAACREAGLRRLLAHDSYLINIAATDDVLFEKSVTALVTEIERADRLGLDYVVMHPGSHVGAGEDAGLARAVEGLDRVVERTPGAKVRILIETTAGQGTSLGWRFEHLRDLLRGVADRPRFGVCVDTCHIFAAGYPLFPRAAFLKTFRELDRSVGLEHVRAFHVNDSKKGLGSRVDRHEHLGRGCIGAEPFRWLVRDRRFRDLPMILETPKENAMDEVNLAFLRHCTDKD
jgi:deoxyribonuclease-4